MLRFAAVALFLSATGVEAGPPRISEDRDLLELNLAGWNCLNRLEGSAKTPDGVERNRLKNRSISSPLPPVVASFDTAAFLKHVGGFDLQTKGKRRKDLTPEQKEQLDALEKQVVSLTGYLVIAYAGPTESTNCGSIDPHDWHLEIFEKPADHHPQIGDPTPIVCEITPRTQTSIYRDNIRLQALAAFIRAPDLSIEPTGHNAVRIRVTGYLLWDDDHNGSADVGTTIRRVGANKYHNPWRSSAWEIHPVLKIEKADTPPAPAPILTTPAQTSPPAPAATATDFQN